MEAHGQFIRMWHIGEDVLPKTLVIPFETHKANICGLRWSDIMGEYPYEATAMMSFGRGQSSTQVYTESELGSVDDL